MNECTLTTLLVLLSAAAHGNAENLKTKREAAGLFPFPRVGRSGPDSAWDVDPELQEVKRQGLIPFPRIGRSGPRGPVLPATLLFPSSRGTSSLALVVDASDVDKRGGGGGGESNGMWFGPRLGRRNKRSVDVADTPWALVTFADYPSSRRHDSFVPRAGREPGEEDEDAVAEEDRDEDSSLRRPPGGRRSRAAAPSRH